MSQATPTLVHFVAAAIFAIAVAHTFAAHQFERLARRFPRHAGLLHLLGEVEVVFGFWAIVLVACMAVLAGGREAIAYAESRQFTEPLFVFAVMVVAASRPVLQGVRRLIEAVARLAPGDARVTTVWMGLAAVPLAGSLLTEPAAMTVAALLLAPRIFQAAMPEALKYLALGVLFVNVSIGGTLTSFAAPPVLMVADAWDWSSRYMLATFGWKAALAVLVNATLATAVLRRYLVAADQQAPDEARVPLAVTLVHLLFLAAIVLLAHHPVAFLGVFLLFLGFAHAYERHQDPLIVREALLVGFFLAGLVVLGGLQQWWLQPLVEGLTPRQLFYGAAALTAITDNAALTYLGSLIPSLSEEAKYGLVAGAVAGGGLTVIANAPNPAGVALLKHGFQDGSIGAMGLLAGALVPTAVAMAAFALL
ncbi:MAG: putative Na+/H+ antiporter [Burkholderiales bacterium]|nr:putative Na+/H+ antiporter [Burkholderiales bacterium]